MIVIRRKWYSTSQKARINPVGIQYLSNGLHGQLFPKDKLSTKVSGKNTKNINLSQIHLTDNELLGKKTAITDPIDFKIPKLQGDTLDEHFYKLGVMSSQNYLDLAESLINIGDNLPKKPKKWQFKSGWIRYAKGKKPEPVPYPLEDGLVFDVETLYKLSPYPVMATCVSTKCWYGWVSPYLTGESKKNNHLIPMNTHGNDKIIVGHNVSYDRARTIDEYNLKASNAFFIDTMSLHVAVSGMCSRQRGTWMKYKKNKEEKSKNSELLANDISLERIRSTDIQSESLKNLISNPVLDMEAGTPSADLVDDPWMKFSSINSLQQVAELHCGLKLAKEDRDHFASESKEEIVERFQQLMDYCAGDVYATHKIFSKIFPEFRQLVPHPVSFASLKYVSQSFLPTTKQWEDYISTAENIYSESTMKIEKNLHAMANEIVALKDDPTKPWEKDPWLSQLDWKITPVRLTKKGEPYKNQKLPGYPEWYKNLIVKNELKLTTRSRAAPLLLKLSWHGNPLFWLDSQGWCFVVPNSEKEKYEHQNFICLSLAKLAEDPKFDSLSEEYLYKKSIFKVPHNDGPNARAVSIMTKSFLGHFEDGVLTSEYELAKDALQLAVSCSYWTSARERIMNQMVVYSDEHKEIDFGTKEPIGMIIPQIVPMGTITRRAVENTWLTASNAKKSRLGSELKSMIKAPPGYCFVGADVDSEELWIASIVGDSVFQTHGGTAIGWMTLEGTKSEGTDLHSKTAKILGISRNEAKVFNYGRIYGAGLKFATTLLKKFNPSLSEKEAAVIGKKLYGETKGKTGMLNGSKIWYGGSESIVFNMLEKIAEQESPRTPVLGAGITSALTKKNLAANSFLPSRINWAIQSSGVDYLHLLIISMEYLSKKYNIDARLSVTVHDEIRYLVKSEDKYKAALILQISNLWTRAMFCSQIGINDVPQSCAFFSAVDIDHVLRKEVDMDCITPSNKTPIPHGESIDIVQLLEKPGMREFFEKATEEVDLSHIKYEKKTPMLKEINKELDPNSTQLYINMQIVKEESEFKALKSQLRKSIASSKQAKAREKFEKEQQEADYFSYDELDAPAMSANTFPAQKVLKKTKTAVKRKSGGTRQLNKLMKESSNRGYIYETTTTFDAQQSSEPETLADKKVYSELSVDEMAEAFR